jgi:hypothetical protein
MRLANRSTCAAAGAVTLLVAACGAGVDGPNVPHLVVEEELRIGALDGPAALGEVIGLAVGKEGELFIAEWNEGSIGVFDRDGTPRQRIGRSGSGPGEFNMNPGALHWTGGMLSAADPVAGRLHLFRRDGALERTIDGKWGAVSAALGSPTPSRRLADGAIVGAAYPPASRYLTAGEAPEAMLARMDSAGPSIEVIARFSARNAMLVIERNPGYTATINPVQDQSLWRASADGERIVIVERTAATSAQRASFAVTVLDASGDTLLTRSHAYDPVPLTPQLADSISGALAQRLDHGGQDSVRLRFAIDKLEYLPAFLPPVTDLVTGRDGTIWLRREGIVEPAVWDVLDENAELVHRIEVPARVKVHEVDQRNVWGVVKDDLDVSYIVRYRISAGS